MPAGLEALRDDRVDAMRLEPARFVDVVADERILEPQDRTRASSSADGRPKWKLTTAA